jgi:hypothetical protein
MLDRLRSFVRVLLHRRRFEENMAQEIRFHMEAYAADLVKSGMPRARAEREARMAFGSVDSAKDEMRASRGLRWISDLRGDLTYAFRSLRRSSGFTLIAVTALGVGIGANATVFGMVDSVAFRKLAASRPDELVALFAEQGDAKLLNVSYPTFEDVRREVRSFRDAAAFTESAVGVHGADGATVAARAGRPGAGRRGGEPRVLANRAGR